MELDQLLSKIKEAAKPYYFDKNTQPYDDTHDWTHMKRVYGACVKMLALTPKANRGEVLIAAILHDIGNSMTDTATHAAASFELAQPILKNLKNELKECGVDSEKVLLMVKYHSAAHICPDQKIANATEFQILADADKIDMFGPCGILRVPIAQARVQKEVVNWAINRFQTEAKPDNFQFQSKAGKIIGQKYKDYLKKFTEDVESQRQEFEFELED